MGEELNGEGTYLKFRVRGELLIRLGPNREGSLIELKATALFLHDFSKRYKSFH